MNACDMAPVACDAIVASALSKRACVSYYAAEKEGELRGLICHLWETYEV